MPYVDHYEAQNRLRDLAREETLRRVPKPKAADLLNERLRKRWFQQLREAFVVVLEESLKEAERLGKAHAAEVREEWEARK